MAYVLDDRNDLTAFINPTGSTPTIKAIANTQIDAKLSIGGDTKIYEFPTERATSAGYILQDTAGNGVLEWVPASAINNNSIEFKRITDAGTIYNLTDADQGIEIVSDTYTGILLPTAVGRAGRTFFISRGSDTIITMTTTAGETIDGRLTYKFTKKFTHFSVLSNGVNWYVL
jgi:hypothetical protein